MRLAAVFLITSAVLSAQQGWKDNLAIGSRYAAAKDYAPAERLVSKAIEELDRLPDNEMNLGGALNTLGLIYMEEGKAAQAEPVYRRSLAILVKNYGPQSVDVGNLYFNLATSLMSQNKCPAAVEYFEKALPVYERWFGSEGAKTSQAINSLGECDRQENHLAEAEKYLKRAAILREANSGVDSLELADTMNSLGLAYTADGKYKEAESAFRMALSIREATAGLQSDAVRRTLEDYANLLKKTNQNAKANGMLALAGQIKAIQRKASAAPKLAPGADVGPPVDSFDIGK